MGWIEIHYADGRVEVSGDEVGMEQRKKFHGLPRFESGNYRSETELTQIDDLGR